MPSGETQLPQLVTVLRFLIRLLDSLFIEHLRCFCFGPRSDVPSVSDVLRVIEQILSVLADIVIMEDEPILRRKFEHLV